MKLIKLTLVTICMVIFANMCQAKQYYCGDASKSYSFTNLYFSDQTAEQKCKWLKTDIIISDKPIKYTYKQCVKDFNAAKVKYDKGECTPVITNEHKWKGHKCKVNLVEGTNVVIKTDCNTSKANTSKAAMDYFVKYYRNKNNN